MDLNYLKYQLKCFLLSDFKINETKLILNSQEPETFCRNYLSTLKLKKEHETALRLQFRKLIDTAYEHILLLRELNAVLLKVKKRITDAGLTACPKSIAADFFNFCLGYRLLVGNDG